MQGYTRATLFKLFVKIEKKEQYYSWVSLICAFYEESFKSLKIHCLTSINYLNKNRQLVILTILVVLALNKL